MKGFKRCENGHIHKENVQCPYCPKDKEKKQSDSDDKTQILEVNSPIQDENNSDEKTINISKNPSIVKEKKSNQDDLNRTFIKDSSDEKNEVRSTRKLKGWIVSFDLDPMGKDYKIFEGRNFIGSSNKCDISISGDQSISSNHSLILCKKNKLWLRDEMSSNGTFLNNEELEPNQSPELSDGDEIKIGNSTFKFKTSF